MVPGGWAGAGGGGGRSRGQVCVTLFMAATNSGHDLLEVHSQLGFRCRCINEPFQQIASSAVRMKDEVDAGVVLKSTYAADDVGVAAQVLKCSIFLHMEA